MDLSDINERLDTQLKNNFGIQLDGLPQDIQNILEELVEFQVTTSLCDVDSNLIREWYNIKRKESLDLRLKCLPVKSDIDSVKTLLNSEEKLVQVYEKILAEETPDTDAKEAELNKLIKIHLEMKSQNSDRLLAKSDVNLKELVEKMQMLNKDLDK